MTSLKFGGVSCAQWKLAGAGALSRYSVFAVVSVVALLYWPATVETFSKWGTSIAYSHGYLLAPISIWLASAVPRGKKPFASRLPLTVVALTIGFGAVWFGAYLVNVKIIQMIALPILVWCGLALVYGGRTAPKFLVPVGLLLFAVPLWDYGNFVLQDLTTLVVGNLLEILRRPVVIDGNFVQLRAGTFEIASGCSGLHFFVVALILAVLLGHQSRATVKSRIGLVISAVILALVSNWIRVFSIVLAGDLTDMQHFLVTVDHYYFGWVVFLLVLVPFFVRARYLSTYEDQDQSGGPSGALAATEQTRIAHNDSRSRQFVRGGIILMALGVWPIMAYTMSDGAATFETSPISPPREISRWSQTEGDQAVRHWSPVFVGASQEYFASFSDGTQIIDVYLNQYGSESQGHELVGYENGWYDKNAWRLSHSGSHEVDSDESRGRWRMLNIQGDGQNRVILASYVIGDRLFEGETAAKVAGLFGRLSGSTMAGAIVVSTECIPNCDIAAQRLKAFVRAGLPILMDALIRSTQRSEGS